MKVFIVENAEIVLAGLKNMLTAIPGVTVIGHAVDEQGAIEQIGATRPDVVILDISLQTGSGINVLQAVKKLYPVIKVMMLTNYTDDIYVNKCMISGADYFFDKSTEFMRVDAVLRQLAFTGGLENQFVAL